MISNQTSDQISNQITNQDYQLRRQALLSALKPNSIAIIPAADEVTRSNDTEYPFRQNSDFFYLTGFTEPKAFLILSNKRSFAADGVSSILFVQAKDETAEIWHGRRLGVDKAPSTLLVDQAHAIDDIDKVLPGLIDGHEQLYYELDTNPKADKQVLRAMSECKNAPKQSKTAPPAIIDISYTLHDMRLHKSEAEIQIMQKSADISCEAHIRAMQVCQPNMYEYQLEATILHHFAMNGARHPAYNTIVGGGENACILHYTENQDRLQSGDLVLIDAGAEYQGYAADITRTFPVNGKFSPAQIEIYELVLKAQMTSIDMLVPGSTITDAMKCAVSVITQGLIDLGILQGTVLENIEQENHRAFFMHGLGHYLGLDVHDVGTYKVNGNDRPLAPGMVLTVEPGIYISEKADVPEKYKSIGVRIEDNIVITEQGNRVLTNNVVKTVTEIEALMAQ